MTLANVASPEELIVELLTMLAAVRLPTSVAGPPATVIPPVVIKTWFLKVDNPLTSSNVVGLVVPIPTEPSTNNPLAGAANCPAQSTPITACPLTSSVFNSVATLPIPTLTLFHEIVLFEEAACLRYDTVPLYPTTAADPRAEPTNICGLPPVPAVVLNRACELPVT